MLRSSNKVHEPHHKNHDIYLNVSLVSLLYTVKRTLYELASLSSLAEFIKLARWHLYAEVHRLAISGF